MNKIPVLFVGIQKFGHGIPDMYLVDEPSGTTVMFKPAKHRFVGLAGSAIRRNLTMSDVPKELLSSN